MKPVKPNFFLWIALLMTILIIENCAVQPDRPETFKHERKLKRFESFWGLHFDRHGRSDDKNLGATLTETMLDPSYMVNTSGYHANIYACGSDETPVIQNLEVSVVTNRKPDKVVMQSSGIEIDFVYVNGKVRLTVPALEIHTALEFM